MNFETNVLQVAVEDIIPNRFQPRLAFEDASLSELANSIKQHGIIQPLVLRKTGDKYEIVAGERRYRAATMAGLTYVPAVISKIDDKTSAEVAIAENVQRKELSAIEEAKSYKALLDLGYMSQEQLAKKMGISQSAIANKLRLLNLSTEVQDAILNHKISERHARSLLMVKDPEEQVKWLNRIIEERLTVRALDNELKKEYKGGKGNMNVDINEVKQNATDINYTSSAMPTSPSPTMDMGPIEIGEKTAGRFFNNLEEQAVNMQMTEAINPVRQSISEFPQSVPQVEISSPESTVVEEPLPPQEIPSMPEMTNVIPENNNETVPPINNNPSSDVEDVPVESTSNVAAPDAIVQPIEEPIIDAPSIPIASPESVIQVPQEASQPDTLDILDVPLAPTSDIPSQMTGKGEEAKTKIRNLIEELKKENINIDLFEAQNGENTIFTITLKTD